MSDIYVSVLKVYECLYQGKQEFCPQESDSLTQQLKP